MKASRTKFRGFLVYQNEKAREHLENNQPSTVIALGDIETILKSVSNKDSDDDSDDDKNNQARKKGRQVTTKVLLNRAKEIMNTAKAVLRNIESGIYATHQGSTFSYNSKIFNTLEVEFFTRRNSLEGVFNVFINEVKKLPALFEWIPKSVLTEEHLKRIELKRLETERYVSNIFDRH